MSLKAGRVGVAPDQVDVRGKVTGAGLSPEQQAKLDRALLTPVQAPAEDKIVGVSTGRTQLMLGIGAGLAVEGGQLIGTEVPEYTASEAGKVLKVNASGELEWSDPPQGGGVLTKADLSYIENKSLNAGGVIATDSGKKLYYLDKADYIGKILKIVSYNHSGNTMYLRIAKSDDFEIGSGVNIIASTVEDGRGYSYSVNVSERIDADYALFYFGPDSDNYDVFLMEV